VDFDRRDNGGDWIVVKRWNNIYKRGMNWGLKKE